MSLRRLFSPTLIVALVLALYLGVVLQRAQGDPLAFARLGAGFRAGQPIDPHNEGYDGQFTYWIAVDPNPATAAEHLDVPAYRYQRILLPLLARLLAFGQAAWIPWTLVLVNVLSQLLGTYGVESWLDTHRMSRWYALTYGLWAGLLMAVRLDLGEPLCYALIVGAALAYHFQRFWLCAVCLGLALFAKETAVLFCGAFLLAEFFKQPRSFKALLILTTPILPFILFQGFLWNAFGTIGLTSGGYLATPFEVIPFMGLWRIAGVSLPAFALFVAMFGPLIVFPAVWGIVTAVRRLIWRDTSLAVFALALNAGFLPFTPFSTFREPLGLIRLATGLVLAVLWYGAQTRSQRVLNYALLWIAALAFLVKE